jgi:hypothetical protein
MLVSGFTRPLIVKIWKIKWSAPYSCAITMASLPESTIFVYMAVERPLSSNTMFGTRRRRTEKK